MSYYISSNDNRLYVQTETSYGLTQPITGTNRIPAVKLSVTNVADQRKRRDKTGRTFRGNPAGLRSRTSFRLRTYITGSSMTASTQGYGPLIASAMGNCGVHHDGGTVASVNGATISFTQPHGLRVDQAVASDNEIRFVSAVQSNNTVIVNAPFSLAVAPGVQLGATLTYFLGNEPGSASIFDYWSPSQAVHRIVYGAVADEMRVKINADYHEFEFGGPAADVIDSTSFSSGQAGLMDFPSEPALEPADYAIIPGHLGQVWFGIEPTQCFTLTDASVSLKNNVDLRANEFGQVLPVAYTAGVRDANVTFSLYERAEDATYTLYQAARQRTPISAMFQLGQAAGQLFGVNLKTVVPEVPQFDDDDSRLQWRFSSSRAQGSSDDEFVIAFA